MFALEQLFKRDETVQRYLAAPLARSRLGYLAHRAEQGAKLSTLVGIASIQVKAVRYLALGGGSQHDPRLAGPRQSEAMHPVLAMFTAAVTQGSPPSEWHQTRVSANVAALLGSSAEPVGEAVLRQVRKCMI